ncbi:MAP7 domain-containing protein 2 isoform X3 [Synchiropus splendidus]|uniref:MAP7 domain-containing protein 2 isoform X3 n=1 Tax=Synchiropus splendidus TaxID=270530 RepID=UPI00237E96DD|nr:MAP7 domain-containing protein 2 isoform X3 [Synchiropus splendidus]
MAEQKRKAEKERLEALVRRRAGPAEARDQLDNRPKRWTWGGPPDGTEGDPPSSACRAIGSRPTNEPPAAAGGRASHHVGDFLSPPTSDQPITKQLSSSSAALHSPERGSTRRAASPNNNTNHRSRRNLSNRRSVAGFPEDPSRVKTPTGELPNTPVRSSSFRAHSRGPSTPKRVKSNRSRAQSPCSPGQFPPSPRHRATTPDDRAHGAALEKRIPKSTSRDLGAESPGTAAGRSVGGTTDAEEASRLLAERRRLARIQKEQEESRRQEQELRRQQEARELQESQARQAQEERQKREEQRRSREEEERRLKEQRWKDMQEQLEREREEAVLRGQKETERKRMEREQQQVQQEQERLQRRKRIDEIMKRTRRSEAEPPPAAILLGPLDGRSAVDELSDGVQSMDVSPVSRDEQASGQDFSPLTEGGYPLLMDLDQGRAQTSPYPRLGDLNENLLIQMSQVDA